MKGYEKHAFPPRADLLAWGLVACRGAGCRVLLAPAGVEAGRGFCKACQFAGREARRREASG